jgi:hypothetical protein
MPVSVVTTIPYRSKPRPLLKNEVFSEVDILMLLCIPVLKNGLYGVRGPVLRDYSKINERALKKYYTLS